jgi:hypothetical protein
MRIFFTEEGYLKIKELEESTRKSYIGIPCTLEFSLRIKIGLGYPDRINIYRFEGYIEDPSDYIRNYNGFHPGLIFSKFWIKPLPRKIIKNIIKNILSRYRHLPLSEVKEEKNGICREIDIGNLNLKNFLFDKFNTFITKDLTDPYNKFLFEKIIKGDVSIE